MLFRSQEVQDTLYTAITELPDAVRSDGQRKFVELYEAKDRTIGDQMRRSAAQEAVEPATEIEFDDREAVLGSIDDALLGTADREFIQQQEAARAAPAEVAQVEPTVELDEIEVSSEGKALSAIQIVEEFDSEDGEATVKVTRTADVIMDEIDERFNGMKLLMGCLRAG